MVLKSFLEVAREPPADLGAVGKAPERSESPDLVE
jgi:hypothetical protein